MGIETTKNAKKAFKKENKKVMKNSIKAAAANGAASAPDGSLKAKPIGGKKGFRKPTAGSGSNNGSATAGDKKKKPFVKKSSSGDNNKKPYVKSNSNNNSSKDRHAKAVAAKLPNKGHKKPNTQLVTVLKDQWNELRAKTSKTARRSAEEEEELEQEEEGMEVDEEEAEEDSVSEGDTDSDNGEQESMDHDGSDSDSEEEEEEDKKKKSAAVAGGVKKNKTETAAAPAPAVKSAEQQVKLVDALLADIRGRVLDVTLRHDASRIVQSVLQFGNENQRLVVLEELCKKAVDVSKAPYGHFAILKAIAYCKTSGEQTMLVNSLKGHFLSLGCNAIGARVIESLYASELLTTAQKCTMNAEFYGKKYTVFLPDSVLPVSLATVVTHTPETRYFSILDHMAEILQRFVNKSLFEFSYVHQFVFEYLSEVMRLDCNFQQNQQQALQQQEGVSVAATNSTIHTRGKHDKDKIQSEFTRRMTDTVTLLLDHLQRLMSTKSGCKAVLICVNYMSVKERKTFIKSLKTHIVTSLVHPSAHLVIMKLMDCVDDTVLVNKSILEELLENSGSSGSSSGGGGAKTKEQYTAKGELIVSEIPLVTVMKSPYGRKALLHLLQPFKHDPSLTKEEEADGHIIPNNMISQLEPDEWEYFQVRSLPATSSKKSPEQRVKEHLVYLQHSALTTGFDDKELVRACMLDGNASRVLMGLIETFQPPSLCQNILDLALENATEDEDDEELNATGGERFLEDFSAHKVVQRCLQVQRRAVEAEVEASGETDADAASASVSTTYWPEERVDFCGEMSKYLCAAKNEPMLHDWLKTNRLSYIVVELLKTAGVSAGGDIQSTELGKAVTRALSPVIAATATSAATPKKKGTPKKATAALAAAVKCENKILTDLMFGAKA